MDGFSNGFLASVSLTSKPFRVSKAGGVLYKDISSLSMQGGNGDIISKFLNELVHEAHIETINEFILKSKQKITKRLNKVYLERELLLIKAKEDRLSLISRIKEEDIKNIREINNQIQRERLKAREQRNNEIEVLSNAAKLARSMGIIENNFNLCNSKDKI